MKGKQTEDNQTLQDLQIKEGDFMVVMVSKVFSFLLNLLNNFQKPPGVVQSTSNVNPQPQY